MPALPKFIKLTAIATLLILLLGGCGPKGPKGPETVAFRAVSAGAEVPGVGLGFARFFRDSTLFYDKIGGAGGGRGFNIAAINPATGEPSQPVQNFDTWLTRTTGAAMDAMLDFLDGLPNGTLVLIAVGDEAGLNADNSCQHLLFPWVEEILQELETLGSTQIRGYCFRDSWAMVAAKGEGKPREERLGSGIEVSAQTTLIIP